MEDVDVYLRAKRTSSFNSFTRYSILKNPAIWLADNILVHNSRTRIFPDMGFVVNINNSISFQFRLFSIKKNLFWGHSGSFLRKFGQKWIFLEKGLSVLKYSNHLPLFQKSEKNNEPFLRKCWTIRQTGRQTDRQTDRRTNRQRCFLGPPVGRGSWNKN